MAATTAAFLGSSAVEFSCVFSTALFVFLLHFLRFESLKWLRWCYLFVQVFFAFARAMAAATAAFFASVG